MIIRLPKKKPLRVAVAAAAFGVLALAAAALGGVADRLIARRYEPLPPGELWGKTVAAHSEGPRAEPAPAVREAVLARWAERPLPELPLTWELKVAPPRQVLAQLATGRGVESANRFLLGMAPWNASGSEWDVRELWGFDKAYGDRVRYGHRGDYDFTQSVLVSILYRFADRPDILQPETVEHIVENLLVDRGGPRPYVPQSLGLVPETENHLLMTESARYLTNQWLKRRAGDGNERHDNDANGLAEWLAHLLENILRGGLHEFNSIPYHGYALQPLMNLEAHAECPRISGLSRKILDAELWRYAFGSLGYRRSVPFRRQLRRANDPDLLQDRLTQVAAVWTADDWEGLDGMLRGALLRSPFALDAAAAPYCPPEALVRFLLRGGQREFFVRLGRGRGGSPEIHSAGPGFLLSAGGVAPPRTWEIAVRPIVLLLEDSAHDRKECFRIPLGRRGLLANRTGVHRRLACGDAPVLVPDRYQPEAAAGGWRVFRPLPGSALRVAVRNGDNFGLLAVFPDYPGTGQALLDALEAANPDDAVERRFVFPDGGGTVQYDIHAPRDKWVIQSANEKPQPRRYADWPALEGDVIE